MSVSTDITEKAKNDDSGSLQLNRKEIIHLGFQNKTKGEAAFNKVSYIGVGFFGVTAFSVLTTWLLNDKFPGWSQKIEGAADKLGISKKVATIVTLFTGGTIASVLPVKALEDHKTSIVKKLDRALYTDEELKDPKIQKAHREMDETPKQTWLSVFSSRVVAFAATFGVFFLIGSHKGPIKNLPGKSIDHISTKVGRTIDGFINKSAREEIAKTIQENEHRIENGPLKEHGIMRDGPHSDRIASRIYQYIVMDGIYTFITSTTLFASTRILAPILGKKPPSVRADARIAAQPTEIQEPGIAAQMGSESLTNASAPPTKITSAVHMERVAEPRHAAELTA